MCMMGLATILSGCKKSQDKTKEQTEETQTKSVAENIEEVFAHAPEGKEIITDYKKFKVSQEDQCYHFDTDYQYYVSSTRSFVKTENCYYIYDNGLIKALDENMHVEYLLCTSLDYSHHDYQSCSTLIPNDWGVVYYKGNLYSIGNSQCLENGEEGEPECILSLDKGTKSNLMHMTAEGSYIYFVMTDNQMFGEL